jgi:hypothetical protein
VTVAGFTVGHDYACIGDLARVTAVPSDNAADGAADLFRVLQSPNEIRADVALRSPPPTEKMNTIPLASSRLPFSQFTKTVSRPSSLTRAVSSETLSVGA